MLHTDLIIGQCYRTRNSSLAVYCGIDKTLYRKHKLIWVTNGECFHTSFVGKWDLITGSSHYRDVMCLNNYECEFAPKVKTRWQKMCDVISNILLPTWIVPLDKKQ